MATEKDFETTMKPTWCPGCGNFFLFSALKKALVELGVEPHNTAIVYGIGCSGNTSSFVNVYGVHSIHGRTLPVATGIKLSNHKLNVMCVAGDGDCYGIGVQHFIHAARRNLDITLLVHNNQIYGLTTGQTSPTSLKGFKSKTTPHGVIELPINPIALALGSDATFVARGFAGDIPHLTKLIQEGVKHKGFAIIDIFQPCITFNKLNTYDWFKQRVYRLEDTDYKPESKPKAFEKAMEFGKKIPIGVFYKETRKTYGDELPQISEKPLVEQDITKVDPSKTFKEYM